MTTSPFLGLRTVIYAAPDLDAAKQWFTALLGFPPYFDQPFYVGYNVGGYELALNPDGDPGAGPATYWGVGDVDVARTALLELGAVEHEPIADVGDGIRVGSLTTPFGAVIGIIENPHFVLATDQPPPQGPGR